MKFASLYSSSKANAAFAGTSEGGVLIDVGCSFTALKNSLGSIGVSLDCVKALLLTHEHSDHIKGLMQFTKYTRIPVYMSKGTMLFIEREKCAHSRKNLRVLEEKSWEIPHFDGVCTYFPTPHDSAESVGYKIKIKDRVISYCTDFGHVTDDVYTHLKDSTFVFTEANYDKTMLSQNAKYPAFLKQRIAGYFGHLSNNDSADLIARLVAGGVTRIAAGHLSLNNNTPAIAHGCITKRLTDLGMVCERDYTLNIAEEKTTGAYIAL